MTEEEYELANTWLSQEPSDTNSNEDLPLSEHSQIGQNEQNVSHERHNVPPISIQNPAILAGHNDPSAGTEEQRASNLRAPVFTEEQNDFSTGQEDQQASNFYIPITQEDSLSSGHQASLPAPSRQAVHFNLSKQTSSAQSDAQYIPACEGEALHYRAPQMINLETSGLRRSPRIRAQSGPNIVAYTSSAMNKTLISSKNPKQPRLAFFSILCGIGSLWSFATNSMPHYDIHGRCHSLVTRVAHDYERINGLFDDTINDVMHHVKSFTTSNENFTFNQMLKENDYKKFFQAMLDEISVHEDREHWTLLERKDMPSGHKTIMAIWSFKRKRYPDGSLNKHKARLCAHGGQQIWG